ncbi:ankyrin repeat domain-containing protein [Roseibacillus ishigakijimensis]|uniref:Ankyrin repeat domain-containing protein n=1 Tax=Roseibacillus ishigakijimensis TaxID=454146 RepID=A0A934RQL1_9BACT|nr:ankyrin repeat domain-containing protein [Roseibacillus ishigakijimensis]MBK1835118.1 ankyrin repeat domain-containing protein [Roseibacillus ishigakijimensis]
MTESISPAEEARYAELQQHALDLARTGQTDELISMLAVGLPLNLADEKGNSLLMLAAYNGHLETTRALLDRGAEVDRRNDRGQTPLGGVAFKGYREIAAALLAHGAEVDADQGGGQTPYHFASMFGRHDLAALLVEKGANQDSRNKFGLRGKQLRVVGKLLEPLIAWAKRRKAAASN